MKCNGTSAPRCSTIQVVSSPISASLSLWPGISSVVTSTHAPFATSHSNVSSTGCRWPPHARVPVEVLGERLQIDVDRIHHENSSSRGPGHT